MRATKFEFEKRFWIICAIYFAGFALSAASDPVDVCMAGFALERPQPPGARIAIPAPRTYSPAVSLRTPVALSMRRNDQPSRPSAMTCCFFSSLKTLLTRPSVFAQPLSMS